MVVQELCRPIAASERRPAGRSSRTLSQWMADSKATAAPHGAASCRALSQSTAALALPAAVEDGPSVVLEDLQPGLDIAGVIEPGRPLTQPPHPRPHLVNFRGWRHVSSGWVPDIGSSARRGLECAHGHAWLPSETLAHCGCRAGPIRMRPGPCGAGGRWSTLCRSQSQFDHAQHTLAPRHPAEGADVLAQPCGSSARAGDRPA